MNRHQATETLHLHISDLVNLRHVVVANLEIAILSILVSKITHKLSESFAEVNLKSIVVLHDDQYELEGVLLIESELHQVGEINEHGDLLFLLEFLSLKHIVLDAIANSNHCLSGSFDVSVIVGVILAQFEAKANRGLVVIHHVDTM